ncbi:MAG TPA: hypothetical protein VMP03_08600 [Methylomirabilota bacterium]|nr:hypothetical protein [Methylomirabilota bacterium]
MAGRKQYAREYLKRTEDGDTIRVAFDLDRGRVTDFTVQLECWIDERWRPVARYDSAHGQAHRDTLDWAGRVIEKRWLSADLSFNRAVVFAEQDLLARAATYRIDFMRRRR